MTLKSTDGGVWVLLPQAVSRLTALFVFAAAARRLDAEELGLLAVATAVTAGAFALAAAVVGKPLAVLDAGERDRLGRHAQSFSVVAALAVGVVLTACGLALTGPVRTALLACAVGVPATMAVESHYWRSVFVHGRRRAGVVLSACYLSQAAAVTLAVLVLSPTGVVLSPFVGLALAGTVVVVADGGLSLSGARAWAGEHRPSWLPYVFGVVAAVALVQAVPIILALSAGLAAASIYRAGELAFGATNLLIGVVVHTHLTGIAPVALRTYWRSAVALVVLAVANGLLIGVLPTSVLRPFLGPVAEQLQEVLVPFTALRAALGVASVGSVLLVRMLTARRVGLYGVACAGISALALVAGSLAGGLVGGVTGLAVAEIMIAMFYGRLLVRRT